MMSTQAYLPSQAHEAEHPYRAISKAALLGLSLAALCALASPFLLVTEFLPLFLIFSAAGAAFGLIGYRNIRRYPDELVGRLPAKIAIVAGVVVFAGSVTLHGTIYVTEVPEGYQRISFQALQPDKKHPQLPIPPSAVELDGKRVFVKGYVHPDAGLGPVQRFVLVPDMGTCCFGGQPKLTDMIEVTLTGSKRIKYSRRMKRLGGVLHVDPTLKPVDGLMGVYYQLEADYVR